MCVATLPVSFLFVRDASTWITRVPLIKASSIPRKLRQPQIQAEVLVREVKPKTEQRALEIFTRGKGVKVRDEAMLTFQLEKRLNLYPVQ